MTTKKKVYSRKRGRSSTTSDRNLVTISVQIDTAAKDRFYKLVDAYQAKTRLTIGHMLEGMINDAYENGLKIEE